MPDIETANESGNGDDLRATIEAAIRADSAELDAEEGIIDEPSDDTPPESAAPTRERDEHGRFAPKKQVSDQPEIEVAPEAALPPIELPKSWSPDQKERFNSLPRETQEYLAKRDRETFSKIGQASEEAARHRKFVEPIERELAPFADYLNSQRVPPQQFVATILKGQARMNANPAQAIRELAQYYKLNLAELAAQPVVAQQYNPETEAIQRELHEIREYHRQQREAQQAQVMQSLESEVVSFGAEKDASGNALRPHFDAVAFEMMPFVETFKRTHPDLSNREILEKAYRHAIAENPEISAAEAKRAEAARITEAKQRTANARKAGSSLHGGNPGGGLASSQPGSLRETLIAAYRGEI